MFNLKTYEFEFSVLHDISHTIGEILPLSKLVGKLYRKQFVHRKRIVSYKGDQIVSTVEV